MTRKKTKTTSKARSSSSSLERMKMDFLHQLGMAAALVALIFSLSLLIGYLFTSSFSMDTTMADPNYLKTQLDGSAVVAPVTTDTTTFAPNAAVQTTAATVVAPKTGVAENVLLAGSFLLGLIGAVTFIVLKKSA